MPIAVPGNPQVSFVVPCYNEAANIADTIAEIESTVYEAGIATFEIIVIDDASKDASATIVEVLAQSKPYVRLVRNNKNLGFGGAYKVGITHTRGTYVIMVPGDNAHPKNSLVPILKKTGEADIIIPYVINPQTRSKRRRVISRCFTMALNLLFGLHVPYFNGTVLHRRDLLRSIEIKTNGFSYQAEALVKLVKKGASYTSVGVEIDESRKKRTTAFRPKNIYRVVNSIFALWREVRQAPSTTRSSVQA